MVEKSRASTLYTGMQCTGAAFSSKEDMCRRKSSDMSKTDISIPVTGHEGQFGDLELWTTTAEALFLDVSRVCHDPQTRV